MTGKFSVIIAFVIILLSAGCATNKVTTPSLGKNKAKITLKPGAFRVVRTVRGEASCPFLFWIDIPSTLQTKLPIPVPLVTFELGDSHLHKTAMQDLHSKHNLSGKPQILHNVIEEWTLSNYLGLFAILRVSISAEVIEFVNQNEL